MSHITENEFWRILNEPEPVITVKYYDSYDFKIYSWYNEKEQLHRENDLPAVIWYYNNGNIEEERWYQNGKLHRIDGPAFIWYHKDGHIFHKLWYLNDKEYREDIHRYIINEDGL